MWQVAKPFWYICSTVESWYGKHIGISKKNWASSQSPGQFGALKPSNALICTGSASLYPFPAEVLGEMFVFGSRDV